MTIPNVMKALIVKKGKKVEVLEHPVPPVGDDDILVKTVAVAQNPTDWKFVDFVQREGTILGCDWSGHVVQVGKNVVSPKVGEHVAGFRIGGAFADSGAYAEYLRTPAELAWVVPEGTISHEQAATLGCGFWTAVQALYNPTRLGLVEPPQQAEGERWVFVYGGSSSVGQYAIQLAHLSGYKVVTSASPHNFALVTALGADAVFDYKDPEVVEKVKAATGDSIRAAIDTISLQDTLTITSHALAPSGGKVISLLGPPKEIPRNDVEIMPTSIYTALGLELPTSPIIPEDRAHMAAFLKKVPALVREGKIRPNPVHLWEGGLEAISDGLQYMRDGKVSAEKIVYRVQ